MPRFVIFTFLPTLLIAAALTLMSVFFGGPNDRVLFQDVGSFFLFLLIPIVYTGPSGALVGAVDWALERVGVVLVWRALLVGLFAIVAMLVVFAGFGPLIPLAATLVFVSATVCSILSAATKKALAVRK